MNKHINRRSLIYIGGTFIVFLFIWISIINSGSDNPSRSTLSNIQKGEQAVEELKQSVYTREPVHDDSEDSSLSCLPSVGTDVGELGIGAFIIILGVFGGVAAIVYTIVGIVKGGRF